MIQITDTAKTKIIDILIDAKSKHLRCGLQGGGCNGFRYFFLIETEKAEDDFEVDLDNGLSILVDAMSMSYLSEAVLDYRSDIMGESFVFNNPNVSTSCGCGSSVGF